MSTGHRVQEDNSYERRLADLERQFRTARLPTAGAGAGWSYDGAGTPRLPGGVIPPSGGFAVPPGSAPPDPTSLSLTAGAGGGDVWLDIDWTPGAVTAAGPVVAYLIEVLEDGGTLPLVFHPTVSQAPPFRASGLLADTLYHVAVHAISQLGASSAGLTGSHSTGHDSGPPATLTGLAGAAYYTGVVVAWTHLGTVQVPFQGHYEAQLATNAGFTTGVQTKDTGLSSVASFAALTTGQQVWVQVRAVSSAGVAGAWSSAVTLTPGTVAPGDLAAGTLAVGVEYAGVIDAGQITAGIFDASLATIIHLDVGSATVHGQMDVARLGAGTIGAYLIQLASGGIIRSANYVAGTSGWNIDGAGNAELNNATFRGIIAAATLASNDFSFLNTSPNGIGLRIHYDGSKTWLQPGASTVVSAGIYWDHVQGAFFCPGGGLPWNFPDGLRADSSDSTPLYAKTVLAAERNQTGDWGAKGLRTSDTGDFPGVAFHDETNADAGFLAYRHSATRIEALNLSNSGWIALGASAFTTLSSRKVKKHVEPVRGDVLPLLRQLRPVTHQARAVTTTIDGGPLHPHGDRNQHGRKFSFIAEEVDPLFPEVVSWAHIPEHGIDGPSGIDYGALVVPVVKGLLEVEDRRAQDAKDTAARLDAIEARLAALVKE